MNYNPYTNAAQPALQGRNPAFAPLSAPAVTYPAQPGSSAQAPGINPLGSVAPGGAFQQAGMPQQMPQMPPQMPTQGLGPTNAGTLGAFGQMPSMAQGAPSPGGAMGNGLSGFGGPGGGGVLGQPSAFAHGMPGRGAR
jgi:hypothetical protein